MEENELYDRIGETDLNPTYKDGQVYQHTDINNQVSILKTAVNENYYDIQKLQKGEKTVGNSKKLDGATLSRYIDEELQADDDKIPSSQQAKAYMDALFAGYSAPVRGVDYWTEADQQQIVSDTANSVISEITPDLQEALAAKANINDIPTKISDLTNDSEFITSLDMQESQSEQDTKINKKPYYFNNVAEMKAYNLNVGDMAITKGYYSINDGGASEYNIVDNNTLTEDGGSVIDLTNGLKAVLIMNNTININQFGAYGNGNNDDTQAFLNCISYLTNNSKLYMLNFENCNYLISQTLFIPKNVSINGNGATLIMDNNGSFTNGYAIYYNINQNNNPVSTTLIYHVVIDNFTIKVKNENNFGDYNGIYICAQCKLSNLNFTYIDKCIVFHNNYVDLGIVDNVYIRHRNVSNNYAINSGRQGDLRQFYNITHGAYYGSNEAPAKVLYIGPYHYNVVVKNCLFGGIVEMHSNTDVDNTMMSYDYRTSYIVKGCDVYFKNLYASVTGKTRITVDSERLGSITKYPNITFDNLMFAVDNNSESYEDFLTPIQINAFDTIKFTNCYSGTTTTTKRNYAMSMINANVNSLFEKYSPYLNDTKIFSNQNNMCVSIPSYTNSDVTLSITDDTICPIYRKTVEETVFYYNAIYFADRDRLIGKSANIERTKTLTETEEGSNIYNAVRLNYGNLKLTGFIRLFKGIESGVYTQYVDVPVTGNNVVLIDDGYTVNGHYWNDIGSITYDRSVLFNDYTSMQLIAKDNLSCKAIIYGANNTPTKGNWQNGDECYTSTAHLYYLNGSWV